MSNSKNDNFFLSVLNNSANHIQFMKKQQWTIAYYCLLLYAAIIALFKYLEKTTSCIERGILLTISTVLCIIGCVLILEFQRSIEEHRQITKNIYSLFPDEIKIATDKTRSGTDSTDVLLIRITLIASLVVGLFIVGWLLYRDLIFPQL